MKLINSKSFLLIILILSIVNVFSQEKEDSPYLTKDWGGTRTNLADKGIDFTIEYTCGLHSNVAGGIKNGTAFNGVLNTGVDIDFEKLASFKGLTFHLNTFWIHGKDGTSKFVGDIGGYNNIYHEKTFRLYTVWLQKTLWDDKASIKGGSIAFDDEFGGCDNAALFINSDFGVSAAISANMSSPIFAIPAFGVRGRIDPLEGLYVQMAIFDGNPSHIGADGEDDNLHGTDYRWDSDEGLFIALEAGYEIGKDYKGQYKLGICYHTADFVSIDDPSEEKSGNYCFYIAGDQKICSFKENVDLNAFCRVALAPDDRNTISLAI